MKRCNICNVPVDWDVVKEEFEEIFRQADAFGMESLTENEQVVLEGKICSLDCYYEMD